MPTVEHSVDLAAPIETVYDVGLDPDNWVRANPAVDRIDRVEDPDDGIRAAVTSDIHVTTVAGRLEPLRHRAVLEDPRPI